MVLDQSRSVRKETGARYKMQHGKKKHAMGRTPTLSRVDKDLARKEDRVRGGIVKVRILRTNVVNLYDPKEKKYGLVKVDMVTANPANRHYVRRNVITKGTIIKTEKGSARVTSRPGQEGVVNAVLV
jgi:small subunit ribosomal protein S8e